MFCTLSLSYLLRAILCLHLGEVLVSQWPPQTLLQHCQDAPGGEHRDRDHTSHAMDEEVFHGRQSTGQAEDVGSDRLNPSLLSVHHPDNMGGKSTDATSIKGFSAGKAFLCSSSSQQEATLDKTLSAALMAD